MWRDELGLYPVRETLLEMLLVLNGEVSYCSCLGSSVEDNYSETNPRGR
jgi:hypothetical protein